MIWLASNAGAQTSSPAKNVVLITLDGMRLEETFFGADKRLIIPELGCKEPAQILAQFWNDESTEKRRELLMPFLWSRIAGGGWIAGNVELDSVVHVTNGKYFSYPGYNELLTGFADPKVDSNAKRYNDNVTVLEWLNQPGRLPGQIAAYCSWDVFPYIINDRRSGVRVNAGWMKLQIGDEERLKSANFVADNLFREWDGVRYDAFTTLGAIEELKKNQPRVLYVSLGETDDWAHAGRYDRYLITANQNDRFIQAIWETCQAMDAYRDQTAFIITSDHGRGDGREGWKNHSVDLPGSERIWIASFGAGIVKHGVDQGGSYQQAQIAATVADLLGYDYAAVDERIHAPLPLATTAAE